MKPALQQHRSIPCVWCMGTGWQHNEPCMGCDGTGRNYELRVVPVNDRVAFYSALALVIAILAAIVLAGGR